MEFKFGKKLNLAINHWFTEPEVNAAGRLGLFRIIFALFYLWHLSSRFAERLSFFPTELHQRILLVEFLPKPLSPFVFELTEAVLVAALILLAIGFRVRLVTAVVLVVGCLLEAYTQSIDSEHATIFLSFYIPLFMLLDCRWGDTYSLDALLKRHRQKTIVVPSNPSWRYFLGARAVLILLSILFLSSTLFKLREGTWLGYPDLMSNHLLRMHVRSAVYGLPLNPFTPLVAQNAIAHNTLRYFTLFFEGLFFLSLLKRQFRHIFVALALVFHATNGIWFFVTFTPILIVYGLFIDWQMWRDRILPKQIGLIETIPSSWLIGITIALAVAVGVLWNTNAIARSLFSFGGWLDWHTIWYLVLPLSLFWLVRASVNLLKPKVILS